MSTKVEKILRDGLFGFQITNNRKIMSKKRKYLLGVAVPLIIFLISLGITSEVFYEGPFIAEAIPIWVVCISAIVAYTYFFTFKDTNNYE